MSQQAVSQGPLSTDFGYISLDLVEKSEEKHVDVATEANAIAQPASGFQTMELAPIDVRAARTRSSSSKTPQNHVYIWFLAVKALQAVIITNMWIAGT